MKHFKIILWMIVIVIWNNELSLFGKEKSDWGYDPKDTNRIIEEWIEKGDIEEELAIHYKFMMELLNNKNVLYRRERELCSGDGIEEDLMVFSLKINRKYIEQACKKNPIRACQKIGVVSEDPELDKIQNEFSYKKKKEDQQKKSKLSKEISMYFTRDIFYPLLNPKIKEVNEETKYIRKLMKSKIGTPKDSRDKDTVYGKIKNITVSDKVSRETIKELIDNKIVTSLGFPIIYDLSDICLGFHYKDRNNMSKVILGKSE